jgi:predicted RNA-binding protein
MTTWNSYIYNEHNEMYCAGNVHAEDVLYISVKGNILITQQ